MKTASPGSAYSSRSRGGASAPADSGMEIAPEAPRSSISAQSAFNSGRYARSRKWLCALSHIRLSATAPAPGETPSSRAIGFKARAVEDDEVRVQQIAAVRFDDRAVCDRARAARRDERGSQRGFRQKAFGAQPAIDRAIRRAQLRSVELCGQRVDLRALRRDGHHIPCVAIALKIGVFRADVREREKVQHQRKAQKGERQ